MKTYKIKYTLTYETEVSEEDYDKGTTLEEMQELEQESAAGVLADALGSQELDITVKVTTK